MVLTLSVAIGLILYIYAEIVCRGAVLARFDCKRVLFHTIVFTTWQLTMLLIGVGLANIIESLHNTKRMQEFTFAASIFIFILYGIKMIRKAWKNEPVEERREDVLISKKVIAFSAKIGVQTGTIGLVLGFLGVDIIGAIIIFAIAAVIVSVFGLYSGYRFGYVYKTTAYIISAICFILSDIYLIGCYFVGI